MSFYSERKLEGFLPANAKPAKRRTVTVNVGGAEITVKIKAESTLANKFDNYYRLYDMYEAAEHKLSREDVLQRDDPKRHSDYMPRPEVSSHAVPLSEDEIQNRFAFIRDCYRLLNNDQIVEAIAAVAPKKKDGTLYKRRHTRFASSAVVNTDFYVFGIEAYAADDLVLEISGDWLDFESGVEAVENDILSSDPGLLEGEAPSKEVKASAPKTAKKNSKANITASKVFFRTSELTVNIETVDGVDLLAGVPVSEFKCLKRDEKDKYHIEIYAPALRKAVGREVDGYSINDPNLTDLFGSYFRDLMNNNFTPWDDDIKQLLLSMMGYMVSFGVSKAYEVKKWPKGIPEYKPKYNKEQSLAVLLRYYDRICAFSEEDVENALAQFKRTKSTGKLTPNQNILLFTEDFYVPCYFSSVFNQIYSGRIPGFGVRNRMNGTRKDLVFCRMDSFIEQIIKEG